MGKGQLEPSDNRAPVNFLYALCGEAQSLDNCPAQSCPGWDSGQAPRSTHPYADLVLSRTSPTNSANAAPPLGVSPPIGKRPAGSDWLPIHLDGVYDKWNQPQCQSAFRSHTPRRAWLETCGLLLRCRCTVSDSSKQGCPSKPGTGEARTQSQKERVGGDGWMAGCTKR